MKIALAQLDVKAGRPKLNVARMLEMIAEAKSHGAELIAFPEMAVGGYLVGDKWTEDEFCANLEEYNNVLREASEGIVLIYGNIYVSSVYKNFDGRSGKFNAVYCYENKQLVNVRFKTLLPTYRVFDDRRYFLSAHDKGIENQPIELSNGLRLGLEVCEDMWWEDYGINVTNNLIEQGADIIINVSASPWTFGKANARDKCIQRMHDLLGDRFVPFYYVNACGVQNNGKNIILFDGDSRAYNKNGSKIDHKGLKPYTEGILYFDKADHDSTNWPLSYPDFRDPEDIKIDEKMAGILRAYKGIDEMMGYEPKYVFGLSGGIDSSLNATLAVLALGKERVLGFNLPSRYNSSKTKGAAAELATNLGIPYETISIEDILSPTVGMLKGVRGNWDDLPSLVEENVQAKIRGTSILSNIAGMVGGVMTNNGNKLEIALGYATLYGDVNGVFAPLGDLTKVEIWAMARRINERYGHLIPTSMIPNEEFDFADGIAPSAELKDNQLDPMKWGYHDRMIEMMMDFKKHGPEDFMRWYINGELCTKMGIDKRLLKKYSLNDGKTFVDDIEWFVKQTQKSVFKRVQSPPIVLLSKTAFGYDLRESQFVWEPTLEYDRLKAKILEGK